jgi:hypothetical protein
VTDTNRRHDTLFLGLLLLVALGLRLPGLWQFDLWQDEIYSIYEARELYDSRIGPGGMELRQLYFLMLHPLAEAFPRTAWLLRLPSLLFGLLGIVATWALARNLFGRWAAVVAAVLVTIFPLHINESQSIRYWSLIFLFGALFTNALLRAMEADSPRDYTRALVWLLLASVTHPTFMVLAAGMVLGAHLVRPQGGFGFAWPSRMAWRRLWLPYLGIMLVMFAVLLMLFPVRRMVGEAAGSVARILPAIAVAVTPPLGATVAVALARLWRSRAPTPQRVVGMLIGGLGLAGAVLAIGRTLDQLPISILYLFGAFPLLFAAVGALVPSLSPDGSRQRSIAVGLLVILGASLLPSTISHLRDGTRFDYRPALARIVREDPNGTVLIWPLIEATWYAPGLKAVELRSTTSVAKIDSLARANPGLWVVTSRRRYGTVTDADGSKTRWLQHACREVETTETLRFDWDVYAVTVYRCEGVGS